MNKFQLPLETVIPGYCACGCGRRTPLACRNRKDKGWIKGQPIKYVSGHGSRYRGGPAVALGMKWCARCNVVKPTSEFYKNKTSFNGLQNYCKKCNVSLSNDYRHKNPVRERRYTLTHRLKTRFHITIEEYEILMESQHGLCAICGQKETLSFRGLPRLMCIDHDHQTGKVRGLLCNNCNRVLGLFQDDPTILQKAIAYLER